MFQFTELLHIFTAFDLQLLLLYFQWYETWESSFKLQTLCFVCKLFKDYRVSSSVQTNKQKFSILVQRIICSFRMPLLANKQEQFLISCTRISILSNTPNHQH